MSSTQVQASVLHGAKDLRIEPREVPAPSANEIQVAVHSTGLCGSDLHYYNHNRNGDILVREPLTLGHESSGVVTAVGSSVSNFQPGDRVALEVGVPCDSCHRCEQGRYNICKDMKFRSSAKSFPHFQGTLQGRINHPAKWCHKLPEGMSMELGALLEPLGVAIHAYRRSLMQPGQTALVFGAGAVGLLAAAVAKTKGAKTIIIADIDAGRVDFAVKNGFAHHGFVVPMKRGKDTDENLAIARETADGIAKVTDDAGSAIGEVDVVFECTGVPTCVQSGIYATKPGGRVMLIGMGIPIQTLAMSSAALREVDLVGVFRYANTYPEGISIATSPSAPDLSKLVTHKYKGLESCVDAFGMAGRTKDDEGKLVLKVVIETA
ncbi:sorbitol dehydrogenase-like protein [Aureobasidium pullulans]|uniref:Sorbitol dehydrogenase-like protein n=1 Tax=Aureobasidium pullulans TaxID=5580 RepID=A0A4S9C277_AURPU|nr:sorbitol dehydrogenase-like protein [Aureobasidium pullulans]